MIDDAGDQGVRLIDAGERTHNDQRQTSERFELDMAWDSAAAMTASDRVVVLTGNHVDKVIQLDGVRIMAHGRSRSVTLTGYRDPA